MEENEALENDPILKKLRETRCQRLVKFMKNISSCLLNPDLLISQAFCVFLYGSFGAIAPYLPLYLKQYNLLPYQVGIILGLSPIMQCLVSPVWMTLAGKWYAQKLVFLAGVLSVLVKLLLFLAVQPHRQYCVENYVNSTTNLTYERSMPYPDVIKGKEGKWKANIQPTASIKVLKTTASAKVKRGMYSNDEEDLNMDDSPDLSSLSYQSRHIMAMPFVVVYPGLVSSKVVIKNSSNWDSSLNVTVNSIIVGDNNEVFNIFLIFVLFVVVCDFIQAPTFGLGDGSFFEHLEDNFRSSPTKVHFTGSLGWAGTAMIVGAIIHGSRTIHCGSPYVGYFLAFYFSIGFVAMAFIQGLWFECKYDTPTDVGIETWKKSFKIFLTIKNSMFLICVLYVSLCAGFLGSFLNWYIADLGGSALVMATVSATRVVAIFLFYQIAKVLVPILGRANVSVVALMCYTICFFCYWLAKNTWEIVAIVAIEGASFGFVWRSCDYFVSRLRAPLSVVKVTKGLLKALLWGVGQGLGTIIGGTMYGYLGNKTFCTIGITTLVVIVISLALLYYKFMDKEQEPLDQEDDETADEDESKIRYDDYDDTNDDKKKSKHAAAIDDDDNIDEHESMYDDDDEQTRKHAGDDHDDDDDDYEQMKDWSNKNDYSNFKSHDDGEYFKFTSPSDSATDNGNVSDNKLHQRRNEEH